MFKIFNRDLTYNYNAIAQLEKSFSSPFSLFANSISWLNHCLECAENSDPDLEKTDQKLLSAIDQFLDLLPSLLPKV